MLAVLTSGLSEIKGDDLERVIHSVSPAHNLILVNTPDYSGGLEDGYRMAVEAIIKGLLPPGAINGERGPNKAKGQINILAGSHLTPADFGELREIARSFGLETIILPDLSSLDGSRHGLTALAAGGTTVEQIRQMASSEFTIAIGESLEAAAVLIKARAGIDYKVLPAPFGLEGSDELFAAFSNLSGNPVPERYQRERRILIDVMRDAHFYLSGRKKVCIALEPDHTAAVSRIFHEMGAPTPLAVVPQQPSGGPPFTRMRFRLETFSP